MREPQPVSQYSKDTYTQKILREKLALSLPPLTQDLAYHMTVDFLFDQCNIIVCGQYSQCEF